MKMNDEFISTTDLDWFATFYDGNLAHFATGGTTTLPKKIVDSIKNYEEIYDYFFTLNSRCNIEIIENNLPEFINQIKREQYLANYIDIASKGLFSYDINYENNSYFLVAKPLNPLTIQELSNNIKEIIYTLPKEIKSGSANITKYE
ncbi:hypothetical protein [Gilliamella intestini]|uniref:Uncharacterized protein n=1 Tax=Gilliamella intestini TaxID=1798183 RepID=A0A1C4DQU6_9GAMM|nr:hypothetical protein [Gilliamella intestini]SCC33748.1 hypothetical protein GA0061080_10952 [Gilliamella intestini]